jgi:hypothetical protein
VPIDEPITGLAEVSVVLDWPRVASSRCIPVIVRASPVSAARSLTFIGSSLRGPSDHPAPATGNRQGLDANEKAPRGHQHAASGNREAPSCQPGAPGGYAAGAVRRSSASRDHASRPSRSCFPTLPDTPHSPADHAAAHSSQAGGTFCRLLPPALPRRVPSGTRTGLAAYWAHPNNHGT